MLQLRYYRGRIKNRSYTVCRNYTTHVNGILSLYIRMGILLLCTPRHDNIIIICNNIIPHMYTYVTQCVCACACVCMYIGFNDISLMFHEIIFSHSFRTKLLIIIPQKLAWRSKRSHRYTYTYLHTQSVAARVIKNQTAGGCVFFSIQYPLPSCSPHLVNVIGFGGRLSDGEKKRESNANTIKDTRYV